MPPVFHALLALLTSGLATAQASPDPFSQARTMSVPEVHLWSGPPNWITNGDFVHPAFSPDGSQLAYSDVLVEDSAEGTALYVRDLRTHAVRTLLNRDDAQHYATYKVFVSHLAWPEARSVRVDLSDGDIGYSTLVVDPVNGAVLSDSSFEAGDDISTDLPPPLAALRDSLHAAFPRVPPEVLTSSLQGTFVAVPGHGVIIQKNYAGQDSDIWLLDLQSHRAQRLLQPVSSYALGGGFAVGPTTVFLVSRDDGSYLFALSDDLHIRPLASISRGRWRAYLDVKATTASGALFRVVCHETYDQGDNPVFWYSMTTGLAQVKEVAEVYDLAVSSAADLLALVAWEGGRRRIGVGPIRSLP